MMFDIQIVDRKCEIQHITDSMRPAARCEIRIGPMWDRFYAPLDVWNCGDYEAQWSDALARLRIGENVSCFVTGVHPPEIATFIETFTAWLVGDEYRFQEAIYDCLPLLDPSRPYDAIGPYKVMTEDGERIFDDWGVPKSAVIS